jgi:hypothetical protein
MGEARDVLDQITAAAAGGDTGRLASLSADDATVVTPDAGELRGGAAVAEYMQQFTAAFPDSEFKSLNQFEIGNTAIDEGYFVGTHTRPLAAPDGDTSPPTGKRIRVRVRPRDRREGAGHEPSLLLRPAGVPETARAGSGRVLAHAARGGRCALLPPQA